MVAEKRMNKENSKDEEKTVAVLLKVPEALYNEWLQIVNKKSMKRQKYNSEIFCNLIAKLIAEEK